MKVTESHKITQAIL